MGNSTGFVDLDPDPDPAVDADADVILSVDSVDVDVDVDVNVTADEDGIDISPGLAWFWVAGCWWLSMNLQLQYPTLNLYSAGMGLGLEYTY
jgi:hypothetical protein